MRLDILALATDICRDAAGHTKAEDVLNTAEQLYGFVSDNSKSRVRSAVLLKEDKS